ncbi:hypothetical protein JKP88DRAFT_255697, partial [Tribonema minus]
DWYNWDAFRTGNLASDFNLAFKHVVTVLRSTGANFTYQISYAARNPSKKNNPFQSFYPGDSYVDQICVSAYNTCGTGTTFINRSLSQIINTWYVQVSAMAPTKSLCIAEMSSTNQCGTDAKAAWIKDTWNALANNYPKFASINWFFENKTLNGALKDWSLSTADQTAAFQQGYASFNLTTAV